MAFSLFEEILLLVIGLANLFVAGYVLAANPRNIINRAFFVFVVGTALWAFGVFFLYISHNFIFDKAVFYGAIIMMFGVTLFARVFPEGKDPSWRFYRLFIPWGILALLIPFNLLVERIVVHDDGLIEPINGPLMPVFVLLAIFYSFATLYYLGSNYRRSRGLLRTQLRYLLFGVFVLIFCAAFFNTLLPAFGIFKFNLIGPLSTVIFVSLTGYAIVRHELLDIRVVIQRGIFYLVTLALVGLLYSLAVVGLGMIVGRSVELTPILSALIASIVVVFGFAPLKRQFERLTDPVFFRDEYNYHETLKEISRTLGSTIDLSVMIEDLTKLLALRLKPSFVRCATADASGVYRLRPGIDESDTLHPELATYLSCRKTIVWIEDPALRADAPQIAHLCEMTGAALLIPVLRADRMNAIIAIGPKRSQEAFHKKDFDLFSILSHQAGVAFENARLYEALKQHAADLERTVADRTQELEALYEQQSNFMIDISHELQTPIAIIKGYLGIMKQQLLPALGGKSVAIDAIDTTLERMTTLLRRILSLARADFGNHFFERTAVSMGPLLADIYEDSRLLAQDKGVLFTLSHVPNVTVMGDPERLRELFFNLLSNAIKYTRSGDRISIETLLDGPIVRIRVHDNGVGIPPDDLPHIFDRFYRATGHLRESGSGLGLSIAQRIARVHGGSIRVESESDRGTLFEVSLPILHSAT